VTGKSHTPPEQLEGSVPCIGWCWGLPAHRRPLSCCSSMCPTSLVCSSRSCLQGNTWHGRWCSGSSTGPKIAGAGTHLQEQ
jgi:hypothetical protein